VPDLRGGLGDGVRRGVVEQISDATIPATIGCVADVCRNGGVR
jgi:hypothetical protein